MNRTEILSVLFCSLTQTCQMYNSTQMDTAQKVHHSSLSSVSSSPSSAESEHCFQPDTLNLVPTLCQAILYTFYGSIMIFSIVGNAVVMLVQVISFRKSPKSRNICKYLFSLALSDIIHGGLLVPFHSVNIVHGAWVYPRVLCPYVQYFELMSVFNTSLTLAMLGVER